MSCEEYRDTQDYLDGRLRGPAAEAVRSHLALCPECARDAALHRGLGRVLREAPCPDPGPRFTDAVMAAVRAAPARAPLARAWAALTRGELAGLALLYTLAIFGLPHAARWIDGMGLLAGWGISFSGLAEAGAAWLRAAARAATSPAPWGWASALPMSVSLSAVAAATACLILLRRPGLRSAVPWRR